MDIALITKNTIEVSEKEHKIVQMLANGKRTKDIASVLKESVRTTESRIDKLRWKFSAETQPHLVAMFMDAGIVKLTKSKK